MNDASVGFTSPLLSLAIVEKKNEIDMPHRGKCLSRRQPSNQQSCEITCFLLFDKRINTIHRKMNEFE